MRDPDQAPEILAPAGGREQFFAALNAGADAVYLGLKGFNARARAENFTHEDLRELVPLARSRGMKVLVTVNVLVKDAELGDLVKLLGSLEEAEVDAIIVQDLGVARIARAHFPALRLHASTQMAIHNLAGVRMAQEMGFRRVVLARELTALELRKIRAAVPREEVELEAFCHGSLCYSYSGLCFFSGAEDARSGNRGECAYTCRQPYKILSEPGEGFLFSMKDLDTADNLDLFIKAGVDTLKIEGRKKDAQYVASTVRLYRERLDRLYGKSTRTVQSEGTDGREDLLLSFQRQPTSFFLKGRYHENVIDLDSPTHKGLRVGAIRKVTEGRITVRAECAIERFDGLRILPAGDVDYHKAYENEHLEFSLRDLTVSGKRAFAAEPGADVEIELPAGAVPPQAGDVIHKVRSADLKRRVAQLTTPPTDARLRPSRYIDVIVEAAPAGDMIRITARAEKFGTTLAEAAVSVPMEKARHASTLAVDLASTLGLMEAADGGSLFLASTFRYDGTADWFVPRSLLKRLKQELAAPLAAAYAAFTAAREQAALRQIVTAPHPLPHTTLRAARSFAVKTDRLETLREVIAFAKDRPDFPLAELVFEPKRAFLPEIDPEGLATTLAALRDEAGVPLRLALPTVIRGWDEPLLKRWFEVMGARGFHHVELGNLGTFRLLEDWGLRTAALDLASDFTLYALNSCTTRLWQELGVTTVALSIEDDHANLRSHLAHLTPAERQRMQAILFKDTPLFIAEACSLTAIHKGCPTAKVCGYRTLEVANPKGERFYVAHESCKSIVYGHDAYAVTHKQEDFLRLGVTRFRLDFLTRPYTPEALRVVLESAAAGTRVPETHQANFDRVLL